MSAKCYNWKGLYIKIATQFCCIPKTNMDKKYLCYAYQGTHYSMFFLCNINTTLTHTNIIIYTLFEQL